MSHPRITAAESQIMDLLWRAAPQTAEQLFGELGPRTDWSETTLKTLLGRLLTKKAVSAVKDGRRYLYSPVLQRQDYLATESEGLVDRLFGGELAPLVMQFAERRKITRRDAAHIRALLADLEDGEAQDG